LEAGKPHSKKQSQLESLMAETENCAETLTDSILTTIQQASTAANPCT